MDATLKAHLSRPHRDSLVHTSNDFLVVEQIRLTPQIHGKRTLGESTECAAVGADIRVVDVAITDIRHDIAIDLLAEFIREFGDSRNSVTARTEQRDDLLGIHPLTSAHTAQHFGHSPRDARGSRDQRGRGAIGTGVPSG